MDNDITITLTGAQAYDFLHNQSLDESSISMLQELIEAKDKEIALLSGSNKKLNEDYDNLVKELDISKERELALRADYEILDNRYASLLASSNKYALTKGTRIKFETDKEIIDKNSYHEDKKSPFTNREVKDSNIVKDSDWRLHVDAGDPGTESIRTQWTKLDSAVVENAIDKTEEKYYSVDNLAKYLNRTKGAIRSRAIKVYGAHIKNNMIVSEVYKDKK